MKHTDYCYDIFEIFKVKKEKVGGIFCLLGEKKFRMEQLTVVLMLGSTEYV